MLGENNLRCTDHLEPVAPGVRPQRASTTLYRIAFANCSSTRRCSCRRSCVTIGSARYRWLGREPRLKGRSSLHRPQGREETPAGAGGTLTPVAPRTPQWICRTRRAGKQAHKPAQVRPAVGSTPGEPETGPAWCTSYLRSTPLSVTEVVQDATALLAL